VKHLKVIFLLAFLFLFTACDNKDANGEYKPQGVSAMQLTYTIGVHPYLNSKRMYLSYRPILDYLEENMQGVRFELQTAPEYEEYEKKLYACVYDFALPNPYQTVNSVKYGYRVIAKMKPDGVFRGIIVARKSQKLKNISDLKGKAVSFPAKTALAAAMMPLYFLHENGLDIKNDIESKFVGSQFSSIMNAYTGDTVAAATWPPPWEQWKSENPKMAEEMEVVWTTKPLVNNGFVAKNSVENSISSRVADLLVKLGESEKGAKILRDAGFDGFEYADESKYEPVKVFLERYNKVIGLPK